MSSAEAELGFSLMNTTYMRVRNSLTIGHLLDLLKLILLGKELANQITTAFVKPLLNHNHKLVTDRRVDQNSMKSFGMNQLAFGFIIKDIVITIYKLCATYILFL